MKRTILRFAIALLAALPATGAMAGKFKVIQSVVGNPEGALIRDPTSGYYYGTTSDAGKWNDGSVFQLAPTETGRLRLKFIFQFCYEDNHCTANGRLPTGALIEDTSGNLYGTTVTGGSGDRGGYGVVYELSLVEGKNGSKWTEKDLYDFTGGADGANPYDGLSYAGQAEGQLYDGVSPLFGTTALGGANGQGVAFQLTQSNGRYSESVLYAFCSQGGSACTDGAQPNGILLDQAGDIFGTTYIGGTSTQAFTTGGGIVFELVPSGNAYTESVLYRFCSAPQCSDGASPAATPTMDASGAIYSTTIDGGEQCQADGGCGTVVKLTPGNGSYVETVLYDFCAKNDCADGRGPVAGVVLDSAGDLFGTTQYGGGNDIDVYGDGGGTTFELSGSSYKVLHSFCSEAKCADGEYPFAPVLLDGEGHVLGTTDQGGADAESLSGGTIFEMTP